jgi:N-acetylglucosaminyldiphosphoundecaprenol N-acetyl-beta-D-mannosaminyltransferase
MDEAVGRCLEIVRGHREPGRRRPELVLTVNAAVVVGMSRDGNLRRTADGAGLVLADGMSVVWATRLLGGAVPGRVTGIDLMDRLLAEADRDRLRVYFLGATAGVVEALTERVGRERPGVVLAGSHHGYFDRLENEALVGMIRETRPDVLFIGMPTPFKETWAFDNIEALGVPLVVPVGGAFDVLAGLIPRAPARWQDMGLEWAWRLIMEPRRLWKRYLTTNVVFTGLFLAALSRRLAAQLTPSRRLDP